MQYAVKSVSVQIAQNHDAWATTVAVFSTKEDAEKAANEYWQNLCEEADEYGTSFVGETVYVQEIE